MKRIFVSLFLTLSSLVMWGADGSNALNYRRSSVYSILVNHTEQKYSDEIFQVFTQIPVPDKYNDHGLSVVALSVNSSGDHSAEIDEFILRNKVASRLVGKWFNRDPRTGICDMELVKARGLYNATAFDTELAANSTRGLSMLQDAGEDLIGNTFLLVNEVNYIDKAENSKKAGTALTVLGAIAGLAATIATGDNYITSGLALGAVAGAVVSTIKGFKVKITTSLYQLVWDEESAGFFYSQCYTTEPDQTKINAFESNRDMFKLRYIGKVHSSGNQTSFLGINEDQPLVMIRKACQRAIDENIVDLQKAYEVFRVKSPITAVEGNLVTVPVGKKEGVTTSSKYEVLEPREKSDGRVEYVKVGTIRPLEYSIWDNRFMAREEGAQGADLTSTTFAVNGKANRIYPGMLVREIIR